MTAKAVENYKKWWQQRTCPFGADIGAILKVNAT